MIIALTGVKGSGKTTTFGLMREFIPEAKEITLARKLKTVCSMVFNIPAKNFDDPSLKEVPFKNPVVITERKLEAIVRAFLGVENLEKLDGKQEYAMVTMLTPHVGKELISPRNMAQYIGTDILRAMNVDIHCEAALRDVNDNGIYIVTDMRFPSEFEFLKNRFENRFHPMYVANSKAEEAGKGDNHPSERHVLDIAKNSYRIDNNATMEDLKNAVKLALLQAGALNA